MTHPLDGARLRVIRAQEHLNSVVTDIGIYRREHPYEIVSQENDDHTSTQTVKISTPPPVRLSMIIGDCVTNARAALDYTVWELARRYFDPRVDITKSNDRRLASFKISENATNKNHVDWLMDLAKRKIPASAIDDIKEVQPYQSGDDSLLWLQELVNTDKHQMPLLTIRVLGLVFDGATSVTLKAEGGGLDLASMSATGVTGVLLPIYPDTESVRVDSDSKPVETQSSIHLAGHKHASLGGPIDRTLEQIVKCVGDIIPRFDVYFR
jgi:hypothetical protein